MALPSFPAAARAARISSQLGAALLLALGCAPGPRRTVALLALGWALAGMPGGAAAGGRRAAADDRSAVATDRRPTPPEPASSAAGAASDGGDPGAPLEAFLRLAAVAGREETAAAFIREHLGRELPVRSDAAGDLTVTFGTGEPRRLVVCPLGEPAVVVAGIEPDGYLRLAAVGGAVPAGALWEQAHEGQPVWVAGARGAVPGVVAAPAIHLQPHPDPAAPPFAIAGAFVDVGAEDAAATAELGIRPLDPVALDRRPERLAHGLIAGPSARVKAACLAAVDAARRFHVSPGAGTVVFAWTRGDLVHPAGTERLLRQRGPFAELVLLGWGFGWERREGRSRPVAMPAPGSGLLAAGTLAGAVPGARVGVYLAPELRPEEARRYPARVGFLGLPALFPGTAVETVALADAERLSAALLSLLHGIAPRVPDPSAGGASRGTPSPASGGTPRAAPSPSPSSGAARHAETSALLAALVAQPGVSGDEGAVRAAIAARLPPWAHPSVDWAGNLTLTFGGPATGSDPRLFLAHMDEVGFRVSEVLGDGRLRLQAQGDLERSLWEGQAALVHGRRGPVPAVFEPRPDWLTAGRRAGAGDLTVFLGAAGAQEIAALGIRVGSAVTMPRRLLRLGRHRVTARGLDDRAGAAALLLALGRIDRARLRHPVTFAWTVREETGRLGAAVLARQAAGWRRVYPVDAVASADSPRESRVEGSAAYLPLGRGAVVGALDPRGPRGAAGTALDPQGRRGAAGGLLDLARRRGIPVQLGPAGGANDGVPFLAGGASILTLSWPCRYLHTPAEVADLRDVEALADLVAALAGAESGLGPH